MIEFICPACQTLLIGEDALAGQNTKCSNCGTEVIVPLAATAEVVMAAPASPGETIEVVCPCCQMKQYVSNESANLPVQCCNCEAPLSLPQAATASQPSLPPNLPALPKLPPLPAAPAAPTMTMAPGQPAPTQIIVQVNNPTAPSNLVQKKVSGVAVGLLFWFFNGLQYVYMGQVVKGILVFLVVSTLWSIMIFTCFLTAIFVLPILIPLQTICLIDTILVFNRLKKGPISPWRCF